MSGQENREKPLPVLVRQFFKDYPDFAFCQTLALNVKEGVVSYPNALALIGRKAWVAEENRAEIEEKLNSRSLAIRERMAKIKDISLRQAMRLDDEALKQLLDFYFKHPYAHGRTLRTGLLPRWLRTFFLSVLVGHAMRRGIRLDYSAYFEMLRML